MTRERMSGWQAYLILWLWEGYLVALDKGKMSRIHGMQLAWSKAYNDALELDMSETDLLDLLRDLITKGYTAGESVWDLSISYVDYAVSSTYNVMYTRESAPSEIPRLFTLKENQ